jgi:hypothetical protein
MNVRGVSVSASGTIGNFAKSEDEEKKAGSLGDAVD